MVGFERVTFNVQSAEFARHCPIFLKSQELNTDTDPFSFYAVGQKQLEDVKSKIQKK